MLALLDEREPHHDHARAAFVADGGPYLVPATILSEVAYMLERLREPRGLDDLLDDLHSGALEFDCSRADLERIRALVDRYTDLPLGFADAAVAACAERNGGRVLTLDRRDFDVVGRELGLDVVP